MRAGVSREKKKSEDKGLTMGEAYGFGVCSWLLSFLLRALDPPAKKDKTLFRLSVLARTAAAGPAFLCTEILP
jgi:hypothetical protein